MRFDAKEFGGRIRDLRKKQGITQEQLSIMLNISANHLAKVETGSRCCSIDVLRRGVLNGSFDCAAAIIRAVASNIPFILVIIVFDPTSAWMKRSRIRITK